MCWGGGGACGKAWRGERHGGWQRWALGLPRHHPHPLTVCRQASRRPCHYPHANGAHPPATTPSTPTPPPTHTRTRRPPTCISGGSRSETARCTLSEGVVSTPTSRSTIAFTCRETAGSVQGTATCWTPARVLPVKSLWLLDRPPVPKSPAHVTVPKSPAPTTTTSSSSSSRAQARGRACACVWWWAARRSPRAAAGALALGAAPPPAWHHHHHHHLYPHQRHRQWPHWQGSGCSGSGASSSSSSSSSASGTLGLPGSRWAARVPRKTTAPSRTRS